MPRLSVSPGARQDLVEVFLYIAQDNIDAARRVHSRFRAAFRTIAHSPLIGRVRSELAEGIRSLPVENYVIYYRAVASTVRILRVLHGARDTRQLFE